MGRYPKIVMWWRNDSNGSTELTVHGKTLEEARKEATYFGYKPPVWYKPWQYITSRLELITVGFYY